MRPPPISAPTTLSHSMTQEQASASPVLPSEYVIRKAHVLTMDSELGELPSGDIHVRDGRIVAVGSDLSCAGVHEVNGEEMIALPGFVDTHWHLWNSALRGLVRGDDAECGYFPVTLQLGPHFTPQDSYSAVRLGLAEGLLSGITTVHNWSHNTRTPEHADAELRAMRDVGIRGRFSYGWGQDLALTDTMNLTDLERVQRECIEPGGLITLGAAVRTPIANPRGAVPISVVAHECNHIRKLGLPITMHARPGIVAVLQEHGLLGADLQLVHPQGISGEECEMLAEHRTSMTCSPIIEMLYAQSTRGVIQFHELEVAGVQQSLSVDSSAASANADFFSCIRALLWSHKQRFGSSQPLSARRLLELATIDGARDLGLAEHIGSITPGKRADLMLVRSTDLNMAPVFDPAHSLVYSGQPVNVDTVLVDGRALVRHGALTSLDARAIAREARESVQRLSSGLPTGLCAEAR